MTANAAGELGSAQGASAEWFSPGRFALLLGLLIVATFPEVAAGLRAFSYYDAGHFGYPVAYFFRESFWRGELPLWNPYNSCGIPFLAQWNTMTLYPPSLFYLIFPMPWSFGVFCLAHLFLAGMGMYFLARKWSGSALAGAVAGAVFAFNGLTWNGLMWANITAALGWMPWVVLAMERAWRGGGRSIVAAALAAAMQLLSGGAEVVILTWFFLGCWWVAQLFRPEVPRGRLIGGMLAAGMLAAGLAAAQLLPFADLLLHSQRSSGFGGSASASLPLTGWANYLVPLFHCYPNPQGVPYFSNQINWISSYYLGVGIVALALLAAIGPRNLRIHLLAGLALFGLIMALGGSAKVYDWVKAVFPPLGFMRFPSKFVLLDTFVIPLLAACGLGRLLGAAVGETRKVWRLAGFISGGLVAAVLVIIWFAEKHPLPKDNVGWAVGNALERILFFAAAAVCVVMLTRNPRPGARRILQTCLILVLWFDVLTHAPDLSPTVTSATLEPGAIRQFFKWDRELQPGVSRTLQSKDTYLKMAATGSRNAELSIYGRRLALFLNFNLLDDAAKVEGFYPLELKEFSPIEQELFEGKMAATGLKDFLGVALTSDPSNPVGWLRRDSFLPMVTAGQQPMFAGDEDTFIGLFSPGFDPRHQVFLPEEARGAVHATNAASAEISSVTVSNQRVSFDVDAAGAAMVAIAQTYYHPWRAYVDGQPVGLWPANFAFQALEVPAGKHRVNLVYEDKAFMLGCVVSVLSLLGCAAWWFARRVN